MVADPPAGPCTLWGVALGGLGCVCGAVGASPPHPTPPHRPRCSDPPPGVRGAGHSGWELVPVSASCVPECESGVIINVLLTRSFLRSVAAWRSLLVKVHVTASLANHASVAHFKDLYLLR